MVDLIRGPKGSVVRLRLQTEDAGVDGPDKEVVLIRNEIKLEDQAAKNRLSKAWTTSGLCASGLSMCLRSIVISKGSPMATKISAAPRGMCVNF